MQSTPPTAGSACVSMPPHADTPSDLKQARHASYKTQIMAEGQMRVDLVSVVQNKKGDPLPCGSPHRPSLEASSALTLRSLRTSKRVHHRPCVRGRGARPITRVHKASCPESTRRAPTSVVSHSQGKTEGLTRGPRVRAPGGETQSDHARWNGP